MKKNGVLYIGAVIVLALGMVMAVTACGSDDPEPTEPTTEATTTEATTTEAPKPDSVLKKTLQGLIDQYGRGEANGKGVTYARAMDLDGDGNKEMIVIHDMTTEIYVVKGDKAESVFSGKCGIQYGQTDTAYEVIINESISPTTVVLFNSSDEWVDENITAVTIADGAASTESLKASTNGENDTPAREELVNFSINGATVSASDYNNEYTRLTEGGDSVNPMTPADLDEILASL